MSKYDGYGGAPDPPDEEGFIHPNTPPDGFDTWGEAMEDVLGSPRDYRRRVYKYTGCGAWVTFELWGGTGSETKRHDGDSFDGWGWEDVTGLVFGSIVEGVDFGVNDDGSDSEMRLDITRFTSPIEVDEAADAILVRVEAEVDHIWSQTHGCEDCHTVNEWGDEGAINPDCETCGGDGTII